MGSIPSIDRFLDCFQTHSAPIIKIYAGVLISVLENPISMGNICAALRTFWLIAVVSNNNRAHESVSGFLSKWHKQII
jgi:hypothetical protein